MLALYCNKCIRFLLLREDKQGAIRYQQYERKDKKVSARASRQGAQRNDDNQGELRHSLFQPSHLQICDFNYQDEVCA